MESLNHLFAVQVNLSNKPKASGNRTFAEISRTFIWGYSGKKCGDHLYSLPLTVHALCM